MIARRANRPNWTPPVVAPAPRKRDYIIIKASPPPPPAELTVQAIKQAVCERFDITMTDMVSARRSRVISHPRQLAMYLSRKLTVRSLPEIGRLFGGRDHTTVIHAIKATEDRMAYDRAWRDHVNTMLEGFTR